MRSTAASSECGVMDAIPTSRPPSRSCPGRSTGRVRCAFDSERDLAAARASSLVAESEQSSPCDRSRDSNRGTSLLRTASAFDRGSHDCWGRRPRARALAPRNDRIHAGPSVLATDPRRLRWHQGTSLSGDDEPFAADDGAVVSLPVARTTAPASKQARGLQSRRIPGPRGLLPGASSLRRSSAGPRSPSIRCP